MFHFVVFLWNDLLDQIALNKSITSPFKIKVYSINNKGYSIIVRDL